MAWHGADGSSVEATFDGPNAIRVRGPVALRLTDAAGGLTPFTGTYLFVDPVDDAAVFTSYETGRRYRVTRVAGSLDLTGAGALGAATRDVVLGADGEPWEAAIEETATASPEYRATARFEDVVAASGEAFAQYLEAVAPWRSAETPAAALAAYVLWSATVAPAGFVARESVLMSKHWMDKVWSWDHCFNALALAPGLTRPGPRPAPRALRPSGRDRRPPGLDHPLGGPPQLRQAADPRLGAGASASYRWPRLTAASCRESTTGWPRGRGSGSTSRATGHALSYYQHGNDSGWDNATTFDRERVIEAPDLAAFLAVQFEVLADLSEELGRPAADWRRRGDDLVDALLDELWNGDAFIARGAMDGEPSASTSLLNLLPLVLGDRLPEAVRSAVARAAGAHLTDWGLATEPATSPHYEDDGYWRGPIWAPSTALIEAGLRDSGCTALADDVSARFRRLCERSGFAENFDARTGAGLRDRAYTWTAAVYLTLAAEHVERQAGPPDDGSSGDL